MRESGSTTRALSGGVYHKSFRKKADNTQGVNIESCDSRDNPCQLAHDRNGMGQTHNWQLGSQSPRAQDAANCDGDFAHEHHN